MIVLFVALVTVVVEVEETNSAVRKDVGPSFDPPGRLLLGIAEDGMTGLIGLSGSFGLVCRPDDPVAGPIFLKAGPDDLFKAAWANLRFLFSSSA